MKSFVREFCSLVEQQFYGSLAATIYKTDYNDVICSFTEQNRKHAFLSTLYINKCVCRKKDKVYWKIRIMESEKLIKGFYYDVHERKYLYRRFNSPVKNFKWPLI